MKTQLPLLLLLLVHPIDNDWPIITWTARRILSSTGTRHRVISKIAVVVCEERRNSAIDETLD